LFYLDSVFLSKALFFAPALVLSFLPENPGPPWPAHCILKRAGEAEAGSGGDRPAEE
jgi:hypothetical protein